MCVCVCLCACACVCVCVCEVAAEIRIAFLSLKYERSLSKLSDNLKSVEIGYLEFKLWQMKESPNH